MQENKNFFKKSHNTNKTQFKQIAETYYLHWITASCKSPGYSVYPATIFVLFFWHCCPLILQYVSIHLASPWCSFFAYHSSGRIIKIFTAVKTTVYTVTLACFLKPKKNAYKVFATKLKVTVASPSPISLSIIAWRLTCKKIVFSIDLLDFFFGYK